jgi:hypothetical protein
MSDQNPAARMVEAAQEGLRRELRAYASNPNDAWEQRSWSIGGS